MIYVYVIIFLVLIFFTGIKNIRPTERGLIERLGKYIKYAKPGFHWIIPVMTECL